MVVQMVILIGEVVEVDLPKLVKQDQVMMVVMVVMDLQHLSVMLLQLLLFYGLHKQEQMQVTLQLLV